MTQKEKNINAIPNDPLDELIKKTCFALGSNMDKALEVAATENDHEVKRMSHSALERKSTLARTTIAKFAENNAPNPDLKTICKLAHALNVPPAILLMTGDDWRRLIRAINDMQNTVQADVKLSEHVKSLIKSDKATAGLKLARILKMYPDKQERPDDGDYQRWENLEQDVNRRNNIKRQSVLAMTAIAQNVETAVAENGSTKTREEYLAILTTLAAIFGASIHTN